jgi:hypothetical protein
MQSPLLSLSDHCFHPHCYDALASSLFARSFAELYDHSTLSLCRKRTGAVADPEEEDFSGIVERASRRDDA